jgi:uncharacterized protein involved in exopolysaccharide biosynthesis
MNNSTMKSGGQGSPLDQTSDQRLVYVLPEGIRQSGGDEKIDLRELLQVLWHGKWIIFSATLAFAVGSVVYALTQQNWYRAEVLLAPADERSLPPLGGQLGGLAALAGVSVGGGGGAEAKAVLRSRGFARDFIDDFALLPVFFADDWDSERNAWVSNDPEDWPDIRDAVRYFHDNILKVSEDRQTGLVTLAVEWTDSALAADWAQSLAQRLNARMREQALSEAEANVAYLQSELSGTSVVTLQQSVGRLLESEMQKLMLARGNEEFAFKIVDGPEVPKRHVRPKRALIAILGTVLGAMLAVLAVCTASALRKE